MSPPTHILYIDGSSLKNPGPAGYGVLIYDLKNARVTELGASGGAYQTNNEMELKALDTALAWLLRQSLPRDAHVAAFADSNYVIQGVTGWLYGWKKNGFKTQEGEEVKNRALWESIDRSLKTLKDKTHPAVLTLRRVPAHQGFLPNERVDEIARRFAEGQTPALYEGPVAAYTISHEELIKDPPSDRPSHKNAKAYSYVSAINGEVQVHKTWADCEARVRGQANAKYKKALSKEDEDRLVAEWSR